MKIRTDRAGLGILERRPVSYVISSEKLNTDQNMILYSEAYIQALRASVWQDN